MSDLIVSPMAAERLTAIANHIARLGECFPEETTGSTVYPEAVQSWLRVQRAVWGLLGAGGTLRADGDLSLNLTTHHGLYVAVVWFPDRSFIPNADDKTTATVCTLRPKWCDHSDPEKCFLNPVPIPGTWSCHS